MLPLNRANSVTLIGLGIAGVGVASYTQIGNIQRGQDLWAVTSIGATLGGLLVALAGSVIWMRRASLRAPLLLALGIGVAVLLLGVAGYVNVHATTGILISFFFYAVLDVVLLVGVAYW